MENNSLTDHQTNRQEQIFQQATSLVSAVADLLNAAAKASKGSNLLASLDNPTLETLAKNIYREALIAESLYVQLQDIHDQTRSQNNYVFDTFPQILYPLKKLSLQQLHDIKQEGRLRLETLEACKNNDGYSSEIQNQVSDLLSTLTHIETELVNREQQYKY